MKISEWKLENSVVITDDNYDDLLLTRLYTLAELQKGSKFVEAILDDTHNPYDGTTIYFMDSEIGLFEITEDAEWDDTLEVAVQKFKVKPKS